MKVSIVSQLVQILSAWLLGFASGFLYDGFRVLRRESGKKALAAFLDVLFCVSVCLALFVAGMSAGEGSLSIAMIAFLLLGFMCYVFLLSGAVFGFLSRLFAKIKPLFSPLKKISDVLKKTTESAAKKALHWLMNKHGGKESEKTEEKSAGGHCDYGDPRLWNVQSDIGIGTAGEGRELKRSARKRDSRGTAGAKKHNGAD